MKEKRFQSQASVLLATHAAGFMRKAAWLSYAALIRVRASSYVYSLIR